jgi:membrane-associated phospholipid phosphatase
MRLSFLILLLWIISTNGSASTYHKSMELSGDIFQIAIPIAAFSSTLILKDFQGTQEFLKGLMATGVTTYGLKFMIDEKRPRHGSQSFPSGHTAMAFFGSGFIHKRYGLRYAIPAYATAFFVGYSRVKIKEHWILDVVGGAAIGLLYSYLFTSPYQDKSCHFYPAITSNSVALLCEKHF